MAARGGPRGEQVVEQVRAPVADAVRLALRRACALENQLPPVVAFAGQDPVDQAAIEETVDPGDERMLPLGPQRRVLLPARELDLLDARRRRRRPGWPVVSAPPARPAPARVDADRPQNRTAHRHRDPRRMVTCRSSRFESVESDRRRSDVDQIPSGVRL